MLWAQLNYYYQAIYTFFVCVLLVVSKTNMPKTSTTLSPRAHTQLYSNEIYEKEQTLMVTDDHCHRKEKSLASEFLLLTWGWETLQCVLCTSLWWTGLRRPFTNGYYNFIAFHRHWVKGSLSKLYREHSSHEASWFPKNEFHATSTGRPSGIRLQAEAAALHEAHPLSLLRTASPAPRNLGLSRLWHTRCQREP